VEKLEVSKIRIERILKQSLGTSTGKEHSSNDLVEELGVLMKRIEYME
jgi:hypothetical protein